MNSKPTTHTVAYEVAVALINTSPEPEATHRGLLSAVCMASRDWSREQWLEWCGRGRDSVMEAFAKLDPKKEIV